MKTISEKINIFMIEYNKESNFLNKLESIYDFIDNSDSNERIEILCQLCDLFNDEKYSIGEMKTILLNAKLFKDETLLYKRNELLKTYELKKTTL